MALGVGTLLAGAPRDEDHAAPPNRSDPPPGVDARSSPLPFPPPMLYAGSAG